MADIQEIPLEPPEALVEKGEENTQNNGDIEEDITRAQVDIAPKRGRGRPPGAKNRPKAPPPRPPPAPKPKAVRKRKPPPPEYEEESSEDSDEGPYRRQQIDHQQVAAEVLGLLSAQRQQRTTARRNRYASWFQNM